MSSWSIFDGGVLRRFAVLVTLAAAGACAAPAAPVAEATSSRPGESPRLEELLPRASYTFSGLRVVPIRAGAGPRPDPGAEVRVHYTGWLADGTRFDTSREGDHPLTIRLGAGEVIEGLEAIAEMRRGERWYLIVPPERGYGAAGKGLVPPNATLIFDVELVDF